MQKYVSVECMEKDSCFFQIIKGNYVRYRQQYVHLHEFRVHDDQHALKRKIVGGKTNASGTHQEGIQIRRFTQITVDSDPSVMICTYCTVTFTFVPCKQYTHFEGTETQEGVEIKSWRVLQSLCHTKIGRKIYIQVWSVLKYNGHVVCSTIWSVLK